jgi:alanyl-tRNA synthetase
MLGNWSFGDYSKKAAIWAWELLTEVYKIQKKTCTFLYSKEIRRERTIDQEAWDIWKELIDEDLFLKQERQLGKWAIKDLVDRVQKFTLTFVQQRESFSFRKV